MPGPRKRREREGGAGQATAREEARKVGEGEWEKGEKREGKNITAEPRLQTQCISFIDIHRREDNRRGATKRPDRRKKKIA